MVFDDEVATVPFMREVTIPPNWKDTVQCRLQSSSTENIELKDTWFDRYLEEDPRETSRHKSGITPDNVIITITL